MVLIAGTVFAWALSLRLLSEALFAALGLWLSVWLSLGLGILGLLGLYKPPSSSKEPGKQTQAQQVAQQQQQLDPFAAYGRNQVHVEQGTAAPHGPDHIQSWVQSAAVHATHCSPPGSLCNSITSPPPAPKDPFSLESSSNGSSSTASTSQVVSTAIAKAAAERMLQAYQAAQGGLHEGAPAAVAVWATSHLLAQKISESGMDKGRRVSAAFSLPPLEYEATAELQRELEAAAPDEFMCPLGRMLMVDPVFTPSGFTYHRPCIMDWIQRTGRDPALDGCPLSPCQLCPNVNLRDQIATWLQRQGMEC